MEHERLRMCGPWACCLLLQASHSFPKLVKQKDWVGRLPRAATSGQRVGVAAPFGSIPAPMWISPTVPALPACMDQIFSSVDVPEGTPVFGLPPVVVPHYHKLTKRRKLLEKRLKQVGLLPVFATMKEAVTPDVLSCVLGDGYAPGDRHRCPGGTALCALDQAGVPGKVSLLIKHFGILRHMVVQGLPAVVVLEDDAWVAPTFVPDLQEVLDQAAGVPWGLISIGRCYTQRTPFGQQVAENLWYTGMISCSHGYVVSQRGARFLLGSLPFISTADNQINYAASGLTALRHDYPDIMRGATRPEVADRLEIYWADPPLVLQWPEDAVGTHLADSEKKATETAQAR
mmetsp:Transcript_9663/g.24706  ORF Transcript_9663/g.24706 Transcript_9663/m.24706 type:complete len:344 (+) Transcript_9663:1-1032(+)